jgi:hypothetical protein
MLFVGEGLMHLAFHWVSPDPQAEYRLEIATSPQFDKVIATVKGDRNKAVVDNDLPEGKLYWRVRAGHEISGVNALYLRRERLSYVPEVKAAVGP